MERAPVLFLATQVEFISGFWTPTPAGAGGKLALAWLTGVGKSIAHPVVAQAELEPVLDFLELSAVMSQPTTASPVGRAVPCQEPRSSCGLFRALGTALGKGRMWVNVWRGPRLWPAGTGMRGAATPSEESPLGTASGRDPGNGDSGQRWGGMSGLELQGEFEGQGWGF